MSRSAEKYAAIAFFLYSRERSTLRELSELTGTVDRSSLALRHFVDALIHEGLVEVKGTRDTNRPGPDPIEYGWVHSERQA